VIQTRNPLPEELARLERRLQTLRSMQSQGRLTSAQLQDEIQKLRATDQQGRRWWLAGESGAWRCWDGRSWVPGDPARVTSQALRASRAGKTQAQKPTRRVELFAAIGYAALVVICLVAGGVFFGGGYAEYWALPKTVEDVQVEIAAAAPLPLSSDQQQVRAELGDPEAFMILFYEEPLDNGSIGDVRTETWSYYTQGVEYTFINGEKVGEDPIGVEIRELAPVPYRPEQFAAYMNLEDVIAAAQLDSFLLVPLEKEIVEGGEVYYADRLTFGLKDDELRYVEALALEVEG
jgi:hypothetical protein